MPFWWTLHFLSFQSHVNYVSDRKCRFLNFMLVDTVLDGEQTSFRNVPPYISIISSAETIQKYRRYCTSFDVCAIFKTFWKRNCFVSGRALHGGAAQIMKF